MNIMYDGYNMLLAIYSQHVCSVIAAVNNKDVHILYISIHDILYKMICAGLEFLVTTAVFLTAVFSDTTRRTR